MLLKLDSTYREVLVLRFYEEMSLEEIAGVTRAPLSTVKSRLYRGLAALKPEVEQDTRGASCGGGGGMNDARDEQISERNTGFVHARSAMSGMNTGGAVFDGEPDASSGAGTGADDGGTARRRREPVDSRWRCARR